ncbi:MAG: hypothetical protein GDA49_05145 [Rhodospirillales bacterium]|nr:hypothetical protein [Rhodospirillales bacterium]
MHFVLALEAVWRHGSLAMPWRDTMQTSPGLIAPILVAGHVADRRDFISLSEDQLPY